MNRDTFFAHIQKIGNQEYAKLQRNNKAIAMDAAAVGLDTAHYIPGHPGFYQGSDGQVRTLNDIDEWRRRKQSSVVIRHAPGHNEMKAFDNFNPKRKPSLLELAIKAAAQRRKR